MKAVMISICPAHCELIAEGKKTIEVRKSAPKIETPFKVYIYCTKDGNTLFDIKAFMDVNGMVIGEFVRDYVTPLYNVCNDDWERLHGGLHEIEKQLVGMACMTEAELHKYANGRQCFAWHISDLKIYDKPKELKEFGKLIRTRDWERGTEHFWKNGRWYKPAARPPRSWCYVEDLHGLSANDG